MTLLPRQIHCCICGFLIGYNERKCGRHDIHHIRCCVEDFTDKQKEALR